MWDVVIVEVCHTAVGSSGDSLRPLDVDDLTASVIKDALQRTGLDPLQVDEVILGHCRQSSNVSNTARYVTLRVGTPEEMPASTVMCACTSGMLTVNNVANTIRTGQAETVLTGDTESMGSVILYLSNIGWEVGTGTTQFKDSLTEVQFCSQSQGIYGRFNMGITAENVAAKTGITRDEQDQLTLASRQKTATVVTSGRFRGEIIPLTISQGRKRGPIVFDVGEFPRETSLEKLAKLKPAFLDGETVTAGNSSGRNDGASMLILMSGQEAVILGLSPLALAHGISSTEVDPAYMGLGSVPAIGKALRQIGLSLDDIQLVGLNEVFAAQSIGYIRELHLEARTDAISVSDRAIALGHPIGFSSSRILVTLVHELCKCELKYGLATLYVASGIGTTTVVGVL